MILQHRGRIFTVTHNANGTTTEKCRDCPWSFTYRERPTPTQRGEKAAHVCSDNQPADWEHQLALTNLRESL